MDKLIWECVSCDARVGCHPGTRRPKGGLANAELRKARQEAHAAFDPLWQKMKYSGGQSPRSKAYKVLAARMNMSPRKCRQVREGAIVTNKQKVLKRYPSSHCRYSVLTEAWFVYRKVDKSYVSIGCHRESPSKAWADAAARLTKARKK